jgi:predicted transcriptional regulator
MYEVRISDSLYERASQAAKAHHVSVDAFVEKAVQQSLEDEPVRLTAEQVAIIRQSQAEIKAGKGMSLEEVKADLQAHRKEWLAKNPR